MDQQNNIWKKSFQISLSILFILINRQTKDLYQPWKSQSCIPHQVLFQD